jgi:hypothetical protein
MPPAIITLESGDIGYLFTCKRWPIFLKPLTTLLHADVTRTPRNPSKRITRPRTDESTSNLNRHAKSCDLSTAAASMPRSNYEIGLFRYLVATWSARRARPFAIIEDEELREIFLMLNSIVEIHSRQTVARDISDMYERSRIVIGLHLQSIKHRLHIALDGWTSPNVTSFLGVTVQYFEKGDIHSFVLDFVKYSRLSYFMFKL